MAGIENRIAEIVQLLEKEGRLGERYEGPVDKQEIRFGRHGSLSIIIYGDSRGVWYDHEVQIGGGTVDLVQTYVGRFWQDWLDDFEGVQGVQGGQPEATYDYTDENSKLLFQVVRWPNHNFRQRRPDGNGGWVNNLKGVRRVLYHLPELVAAKKTGNGHPWRVYLCEGEKDADRLIRDWGVVATTNPMGGSNWDDSYDAFFSGAEIILLEDNDKTDPKTGKNTGRDRSAKLAARLSRVASVKIIRPIVRPEGQESGEDISDWMDAGGSQSVFEDIIDNTEAQAPNDPGPQQDDHHRGGWKPEPTPWIHPEDPWQPLLLTSLQGRPIPIRQWVANQWLPRFETTGLSGAGGQGKTLVALQLATAAALGLHWFGIPLPRMRVFALLCEDRQDDVHIRQVNINRGYQCEFEELENLIVYPRRSNPNNRLMYFDRDRLGHTTTFFDQLLRELTAWKPDLIILDTRADLFFGDQNDEEQARTFIRLCTDRLAEVTGGAVLLLYHPSRAGRSDGSGESGSVQWDGAFRTRWYLYRPEKKEDDYDDPNERILQRIKSNFSARDEEMQLRWMDGIFERTDEPELSGFDAAAADRKAERVFMELMVIFRNDKIKLTNDPGYFARYAPKLFARHEKAEGVREGGFKRAMAALINLNKIKLVKDKRKDANRFWLAIVNGYADDGLFGED